ALNLGIGRHSADDVLDLLQGRYSRVPTGFGDPRLLGRQVKILGIGVRNPGLVPWLSGQPEEEPLQGAERGVERGLAKGVLRSKALLFRKMRLKALRLLDMESLEVAESGVGFEAVQCLRDAGQRSLAETLGLDQPGEVRALDPLVLGAMRFHGFEPSCRSHNSRRGQRSLLGADGAA